MAFLLLYIGEGRLFDMRTVCDAITGFGGKSHDTVDLGASATFGYYLDDDLATIAVSGDLETIHIDGTGVASLDTAFKIQAVYPEPIRLIDEAFTFDVILADYASLPALVNDLNERWV